MKRYYIAPLADMQALATDPVAHVGEYHYIDLGSHGTAGAGFVAVVLLDESKQPLAGWHELPHLLDAQTTLATSATALAQLANVGATAAQTGYSLAKLLGTIHQLFTP